MADQPVEPPAVPAPLPPDSRDQLIRLIVEELGGAFDAAVAAGADPARLVELVDERRRALETTEIDAAQIDPDG